MKKKKTHAEKIREWELKRQEAIKIANSLPVKSLTLAQAAALLPSHPEWD
jgi:hypothetical protein